jgi:hypothetical protein
MMRIPSLLLLICVVPQLALAEQRSCPTQPIKKSEISNIVERRQSTFEHCLQCEGDQCQFRDWPAEGQDFSQACRLFFCTPTKVPRKMLVLPGTARDGGVFFTYGINNKGRVKDVEITRVVGDTTEEMGRELINDFFERRRYEPIVNNGKAYELNQLNDGTNYEWRGVMP